MFGHKARAGGTAPSGGEALRLEDVRKVYGVEDNRVVALDGVSLSLPAGSFTAVMGPSGSGKSTLLQCAAGLDRPTSGRVVVDGAELSGDGEAALTRFRRERIGFVFQQFNLLPTLTVMQNVTLPLKLAGRRVDKARARDVLDRVGLGHRRPAIARQVWDHQRKARGQSRRHAVPHHVGFGVTVQQQQRRSAAAGAREDLARRSVDPVRGKSGEQVGEIGHRCGLRHHPRKRMIQ